MEFQTSIDIAAPIQRVWAVMKDVERWPEWTETVRSVKRLEDGPLRVGSKVRIYQPRLLPAVFNVVSLEEGKGFTWVTRSGGVTATADHRVEPVGGGTRASLSVKFEGWLAPLMGRMMKKLTNEYLAIEAAGLKRRSEEQKA